MTETSETTRGMPTAATELSAVNEFARCIVPMLDALKWRGDQTCLHEAVPFDLDEMTEVDFLNTMANLRFKGTVRRFKTKWLRPHLLPCLFVSGNGNVRVVLKQLEEGFLVYNGRKGIYENTGAIRESGHAVFFEQIKAGERNANSPVTNWFVRVLRRFAVLITVVLAITMVTTLLTLLTPAFIMITYDQVLVSESMHTLAMVGYGVSLYIVALLGFNLIRAHTLNFLASRLGLIVGNQVLRRILYLPLSHTEIATLSSQLARIRDFESVQAFFSGRSFVALLEIPFILILLLALFAIAGPVALVPLGAALALLVFALLVRPSVKRVSEDGASAAVKRQELILEILSCHQAIKDAGLEKRWAEEYRVVSAETAFTSHRSARIVAAITSFSQGVVTAAGLVTLTLGVVRVVENQMTAGALMASMILVWRIIGPMRSGFNVITQLTKIKKSVAQLDRLMTMPLENDAETALYPETSSAGSLEFKQVSFRYATEAAPALLGVSFKVEPGEMLVVTGHDGAGKTTMTKLLLGLYQPQTGRAMVSNMNVRQLDAMMLRRSISTVPEQDQIFYGTIRQNLNLGSANAEQRLLDSVLSETGLDKELSDMPNGLDTLLESKQIQALNASFRKRVCIARALLRKSQILILDQTGKVFADSDKVWFDNWLQAVKGTKTVVLLTNNVDYFERADKVLKLDQGRVRFWGTGEEAGKNMA